MHIDFVKSLTFDSFEDDFKAFLSTAFKPLSHCPGSASGLATDLLTKLATDDPYFSTGE